MKTQILLMLYSLIFMSLISCSNDEVKIEKDYNINSQLVLPKGSLIKINKANNSVDFRLPKGFVLIGETNDGKLSDLYSEGTLTCTCNSPSNGGCSPFIANGPGGELTGCVMDNCTSCTGEVKAKGSLEGKLETINLDKINIVNSDNVINFVVEIEEFESLRNPTSEIMNSKLIIDEITNFLKGFQSQNKEGLAENTSINTLRDIGYTLVPINLYGYRVYLPIDKSLKLITANPLINDVIFKYLNDERGEYSCKCNTSETGCVLKSKTIPFIGSATWCEADNCSSCSLTTK